MVVEIEGYETEAIIWGKKCGLEELRMKMLETLNKAPEKYFVALFCRMWDFAEILYTENMQVDFVIDTDTHIVYKPRL